MFSLFIQTWHGVLPPKIEGRGGNFEKIKSLGEEGFFHQVGGGGSSDNSIQKREAI